MKRIKRRSLEKIWVGMAFGMLFIGFVGRIWIPDILIFGMFLENLIILGIALGLLVLSCSSEKIAES